MPPIPTLRGPRFEDLRTSFRAYYADRHVRARLLEFFGGTSLETSSCHYITNYSETARPWFHPRPVNELWPMLDRELEVERSLWDRASLVAHLDIEYVNFDRPWAAYVAPEYAMEVQRPVVLAIREVLGRTGIRPLELLSGRGYHFVWRLPRSSDGFLQLSKLGRLHETTRRMYERPHRPSGAALDVTLGAAYAGLGLVMEYVTQEVLRKTATTSSIPVQVTAVEVGPGPRGREIISIDLSEYGDPLHRRTIRVPFGAYLKAHRLNAALDEPFLHDLPPLVMIPMTGLDAENGIALARNLNKARDLAREADVRIPDQSVGTRELIRRYEQSGVADFHDWFYSQEPHEPKTWPETYDRTPLEALPPCVRAGLERPNDLLLRPAAIQHTARVLLSLGWHPRHISGLIRSKYERDHGWIEDRHFHDPVSRADFYTRLFCGLVVNRLDGLVDFNCRSNQEKGYCRQEGCKCNLVSFRDSLLARSAHERLASRPFHRLFLPHQHPRVS